jgi:hypothetical protein
MPGPTIRCTCPTARSIRCGRCLNPRRSGSRPDGWHQELQLQQLRQEMDSQRFEIERERHERKMKEFRESLDPDND